MSRTTAKRRLMPTGGNDRVYTPFSLAAQIVAHFEPSGRMLEPCAGQGAFLRAMAPYGSALEQCEIDHGTDFFTMEDRRRFDWILTNPPWSQFRPFLKKSMKLANNVVFLCTVNHFMLKARIRDIDAAGFGFAQILFVDTPPLPWPQSGFQLGAVHIKYGYAGPCEVGRL